MNSGRTSKMNSNGLKDLQADDAPFEFTNYDAPCKFCGEQVLKGIYLPSHWLQCAGRKREELKATPSIYEHSRNLAESEFGKLEVTQDDVSAVKTSASKFCWMMRALEGLGDNNYLGLLESLDEESELDRQVAAIMIGLLIRGGNTLVNVLAIEDSVGHDINRLVDNVNNLPYWRVYEVEWLKSQIGISKSKSEIYEEFLNLDRVRRDCLPGRFPQAVAIWLFRFKEAEKKPL